MGLLADLGRRIPDRWFFRRLLPAVVFVVIAVVCGGQLGQAHWNDLAMARDRVAAAVRTSGSAAPEAAASAVLLAVAAALLAFAVPVAADCVDALASGSWPWWLAPLGDRLRAARIRRWCAPEELAKEAVRLRAARHPFRAARIEARLAAASAVPPEYCTWTADQFAAARKRIRERAGVEITSAWTSLLVVAPREASDALTAARDSYDAACEAVIWSVSAIVLGVWWWPAAAFGILLALMAGRWLRSSVTGLCETAEAIAVLFASRLPKDGLGERSQ